MLAISSLRPRDLAKIDRVARKTGFVSRRPMRGPRYGTGRSRQLNLKVTEVTLERFYWLADEMNQLLVQDTCGAAQDLRLIFLTGYRSPSRGARGALQHHVCVGDSRDDVRRQLDDPSVA